MTAWLPHRIPGHGISICTGPISVFTMHNTGSTLSRSGGGARAAMRSWMICGDCKTIISIVSADGFGSIPSCQTCRIGDYGHHTAKNNAGGE